MIRQLADGVTTIVRFPHGLLCREPLDGDTNGNEPFFFVPGSLKLFQEDRADGRGGLLLSDGRSRAAEDGDEQDGVTHGF